MIQGDMASSRRYFRTSETLTIFQIGAMIVGARRKGTVRISRGLFYRPISPQFRASSNRDLTLPSLFPSSGYSDGPLAAPEPPVIRHLSSPSLIATKGVRIIPVKITPAIMASVAALHTIFIDRASEDLTVR
jgi:hypothetical protein